VLLAAFFAVLGAAFAGSASSAVPRGPKGVVPAHVPVGAGAAAGAGVGAGAVGRSPLTPLATPRRPLLHPRKALEATPTPTLIYQGGPVMHSTRVYTIFWQPEGAPKGVELFSKAPVTYQKAVNTFFADLAEESGKFGNTYSVATQYYDLSGPGDAHNPVSYATTFPEGDTAEVTDELPAASLGTKTCEDRQPEEGGKSKLLPVCLSEVQIEEEIAKVVKVRGWTTGPSSIFFLYTPPEVGGCFKTGEASLAKGQCSYSYYCAYHDYIPVGSESEEIIFADMPYGATPTCDNKARPEGSDAGPAIDAGSHEHIEAITDPQGGTGWIDSVGSELTNTDFLMEIGDLCVLEEPKLTYGLPLEGSPKLGEPGAFNQQIAKGRYLLQQEWSDAATKTNGGCEQRLLPASFALPTSPQSGQELSFDASASGTVEYPVTKWTWDFGDGTVGEGAKVAHTYAGAGEYTVTLTVTDANLDSNTSAQKISVASPGSEEGVGGGPGPGGGGPGGGPGGGIGTGHGGGTGTPTLTTPGIAGGPGVSFASLSNLQVAATLGLPLNGTPFRGLGTITLGHASCPPACWLSVSLEFTKRGRRHGHRTARKLNVGAARISIASGSARPIAIKLNGAGRAILRRNHHITVHLNVSVIDSVGNQRQLSGAITLTAPAAHHKRRRR
jgi:hypothetical protein